MSEEHHNEWENMFEHMHHMLDRLEKEAKKQLDYMIAEGFVEKTDKPGIYKYTPEAIAVIEQRVKQLEDGDLS